MDGQVGNLMTVPGDLQMAVPGENPRPPTGRISWPSTCSATPSPLQREEPPYRQRRQSGTLQDPGTSGQRPEAKLASGSTHDEPSRSTGEAPVLVHSTLPVPVSGTTRPRTALGEGAYRVQQLPVEDDLRRVRYHTPGNAHGEPVGQRHMGAVRGPSLAVIAIGTRNASIAGGGRQWASPAGLQTADRDGPRHSNSALLPGLAAFRRWSPSTSRVSRCRSNRCPVRQRGRCSRGPRCSTLIGLSFTVLSTRSLTVSSPVRSIDPCSRANCTTSPRASTCRSVERVLGGGIGANR